MNHELFLSDSTIMISVKSAFDIKYTCINDFLISFHPSEIDNTFNNILGKSYKQVMVNRTLDVGYFPKLPTILLHTYICTSDIRISNITHLYLIHVDCTAAI